MIGTNIRHYRKAKGLSQEEMAVKLNVVRQTVSKWENGLSVPDADILIRVAELLDVSVNKLLGIKDSSADMNLSKELAKLREQLAQKIQRETLLLKVNRKRGLILWLSFLTMLIALLVQNERVSILLVGLSILITVAILYRNLALLTGITTNDLRIRILRITTLFHIGIFIVGIGCAFLLVLNTITFSENEEKMFAMGLITCVILFAGIVSPKLPYNKHTGLRLPWTVQDEDTWNVAHRIIGYISFPVVLLYFACTWTIANFEVVTLFIMVIWIGIPGGISFAFFRKKMRGKLK